MAIEKQINIVVKETGMDKVNKSINDLENAVHDTEQSTKNLKQQFREAQLEVQKLADTYGIASKQVVEASKRAADLKDRIEDANDSIQAFKGEGTFIATSKALGAVASGFGAVEGAMNLVGNESEDVQKALLKVQSLMALSQGLEGLEDAGRSFKQLKTNILNTSFAQKVNNVATAGAVAITKLFGKAVDNNSKSFKLLKGAIIGTGIGALIVGVGLLINNFDKIKQVVLNFVPGLAKVGDIVMNIVNAVTDFLGLTSETERALDRQKETAEKALKQNEKFLKLNEHKLTEAQKRELELKNEHLQRVADGIANNEESLKIYNEKLAKDKLEKQKEEQDKANEIRQKANEKANERARQRAKEQSDAEIEILKEKFADEKTSFEEQRKLILADTKITADEKAKLIKEINKAEKEAIKKNEEEILNLRLSYTKKIEDLNAETELEKIELEEERALEELERLSKSEEDKIELIAYYTQLKKEAEDKELQEKLQKEKELQEKITAKEKEESEKKKALAKLEQDYKIETANNVLNVLGALSKSGSRLAKGVAVAQATISTYQGVNKALAETTDFTPTQTLRFANAAAVGVAGALNIAKILSTPETSTGGTGASAGSGQSQPQAPSFNLIQGTGRNQIAEGLQNQAPLKAYVVTKDVTTGQSMDRNIIERASI